MVEIEAVGVVVGVPCDTEVVERTQVNCHPDDENLDDCVPVPVLFWIQSPPHELVATRSPSVVKVIFNFKLRRHRRPLRR